jgi:hypothetical protein
VQGGRAPTVDIEGLRVVRGVTPGSTTLVRATVGIRRDHRTVALVLALGAKTVRRRTP